MHQASQLLLLTLYSMHLNRPLHGLLRLRLRPIKVPTRWSSNIAPHYCIADSCTGGVWRIDSCSATAIEFWCQKEKSKCTNSAGLCSCSYFRDCFQCVAYILIAGVRNKMTLISHTLEIRATGNSLFENAKSARRRKNPENSRYLKYFIYSLYTHSNITSTQTSDIYWKQLHVLWWICKTLHVTPVIPWNLPPLSL